MRKKKIIISIVAAVCVLACVFFAMRFGVAGRIYDAVSRYVVQDKVEAEEVVPEELKQETFLDKDGNEIIVEMRKIIVEDEEGNELEGWVDTAADKAEGLTIYDHIYKGRIEKIEDNKIYFMVDKKEREGDHFIFEDVEDYEIIFDIDTYDLESDSHVGHDVCDSLGFWDGDLWDGDESFYSADELEFLVDKDLVVQDSMGKDYYTGEECKVLLFQ